MQSASIPISWIAALPGHPLNAEKLIQLKKAVEAAGIAEDDLDAVCKAWRVLNDPPASQT
jgi:hypothetical protein